MLYDRGVNLWHHFYKDGKPSWKLVGYIDLQLKQGEKYTLTADLLFTPKGRFMTIGCNDRTYGCRIADDWNETYYVGFTGCEGKNRFFSFKAETSAPDQVMSERTSD